MSYPNEWHGGNVSVLTRSLGHNICPKHPGWPVLSYSRQLKRHRLVMINNVHGHWEVDIQYWNEWEWEMLYFVFYAGYDLSFARIYY